MQLLVAFSHSQLETHGFKASNASRFDEMTALQQPEKRIKPHKTNKSLYERLPVDRISCRDI
jgi:hypothetical protein